MKYRLEIVLAMVVSVVLWFLWTAENSTETAPDHAASAQIARTDADGADIEGALVTQAVDPVGGDRAEAPTTPDASNYAEGPLPFGRVSPSEIENSVYQRIAEQPGLKLTSLTSVECDTLRCRIVFSGMETNPQHVGKYGDLVGALIKPPWNDYQPTSGGISTREISAGAREYVLEFTYVALVDASDDSEVAARQNAACAGAWTRVTQLRGSNEYIRMAHVKAAEYLKLAASVLGLEEAQRLADELQFGPLTRECGAAPY